MSGTPKRLRTPGPRRGRVVQKKGLAGHRDDSREAGADRDGAADLLRRSADGGAHAEQLALAEEDGRRVGAVGGLEEDAEELRQQGRQAALLERGAGDPLERDEPPDGLVALARTELDVVRAKLLALPEEVREGLDARAKDVRVERLGEVVRGADRVALPRVPLVAMDGREEDDRQLAARRRRPDARREPRSRPSPASGRRGAPPRTIRSPAFSMASWPERAMTSSSPSGWRTASSATRFAGESSTSRMRGAFAGL